jgi:hypothetical protein
MFSSLLLAAHEEVKNEASERYAVYLHRCEVAAARGPHDTRNAVVLVDENTAPECAHLSRAGEEELKADVDDDDDFLCSLRRDELAELKLEVSLHPPRVGSVHWRYSVMGCADLRRRGLGCAGERRGDGARVLAAGGGGRGSAAA